jgi:hypothetical protein
MQSKIILPLLLLWSLLSAGCGQETTAQAQEPATVGKYGYVGGIHASTRDRSGKTPISATRTPELYHSMKTGPGKYVVEVPNGEYEVRLHFIQAVREGKTDPRIPIDVFVEGKQVEEDLLVSDLRQDKAEGFRALVKSYEAKVTDGKLDVEFPWQGPPRHGLCGVEVIGEGLTFRVNAGGSGFKDPSGSQWRRDELYPIPAEISVKVPAVAQSRKWVKISDGFKRAMAEAGVYPLMRWYINWAPNPGIMCVFADRAGNTFVNVAGNGLWRYEPEAGRLSRADGGKYTSLADRKSVV